MCGKLSSISRLTAMFFRSLTPVVLPAPPSSVFFG